MLLRQVAGEDYFASAAAVRTFYVASDACRAALRDALEVGEK